ncbi:MAG: hypothetical protein P4L50_20090 [Anaerolineaceae bacterium]|nr:hypothetical protein [Anaerolineaceae bacterium]
MTDVIIYFSLKRRFTTKQTGHIPHIGRSRLEFTFVPDNNRARPASLCTDA